MKSVSSMVTSYQTAELELHNCLLKEILEFNFVFLSVSMNVNMCVHGFYQ